MSIPVQLDLIGCFAGNMHLPEPNPINHQHFSSGRSAPRQTDPAWFNSIAPSPTYNMVPEGGFNPMASNQVVPGSTANWMRETPIDLGSNHGGGRTYNAPQSVFYSNVDLTSRKREFEQYNHSHEQAKMPRSSQQEVTFEEAVGAPWQGNYNDPGYQTIALDSRLESTAQRRSGEQALTGSYPPNLQEDTFQDTNNAVPMIAYDFNFIGTDLEYHDFEIGRPTDNTQVYTQQWIPDNNDNLGLMDLDWVYPEGVCNFGTYSNYVNEINPWTEVEAERESAFSSSATDTLQMGNNEGESSSSQSSLEPAEQTSRATRTLAPTEGLGLSEEAEKELVAKRANNRRYTAKHSRKIKDKRESYKNEAELLSKNISRQQQYRENIEKIMSFVGEALEKWYPDFLTFSDETNGYRRGKSQLRQKFRGQKSLDSELKEANKKHAAGNQKFLDAALECKQGKSKTSTPASRKSRAKSEAEHWEKVYKVLDSQWSLCFETKMAGLATLYVQRTMPTVISKLNPILNDVRDQCYQTNKGKKGFDDFMEFLKEHRNLFMVQRRSLPSGSTGFMRM